MISRIPEIVRALVRKPSQKILRTHSSATTCASVDDTAVKIVAGAHLLDRVIVAAHRAGVCVKSSNLSQEVLKAHASAFTVNLAIVAADLAFVMAFCVCHREAVTNYRVLAVQLAHHIASQVEDPAGFWAAILQHLKAHVEQDGANEIHHLKLVFAASYYEIPTSAREAVECFQGRFKPGARPWRNFAKHNSSQQF